MVRGVKKDDRRELLRGASLFSACSNRELDRIASITTPIVADAGQVLTREGETGEEFFVVVDGTATAYIGDRLLADLGAGSFFGELALLDGGPRTATVTATGPMSLLVLNRGEFCQLVESSIPSSLARCSRPSVPACARWISLNPELRPRTGRHSVTSGP